MQSPTMRNPLLDQNPWPTRSPLLDQNPRTMLISTADQNRRTTRSKPMNHVNFHHRSKPMNHTDLDQNPQTMPISIAWQSRLTRSTTTPISTHSLRTTPLNHHLNLLRRTHDHTRKNEPLWERCETENVPEREKERRWGSVKREKVADIYKWE